MGAAAPDSAETAFEAAAGEVRTADAAEWVLSDTRESCALTARQYTGTLLLLWPLLRLTTCWAEADNLLRFLTRLLCHNATSGLLFNNTASSYVTAGCGNRTNC